MSALEAEGFTVRRMSLNQNTFARLYISNLMAGDQNSHKISVDCTDAVGR